MDILDCFFDDSLYNPKPLPFNEEYKEKIIKEPIDRNQYMKDYYKKNKEKYLLRQNEFNNQNKEKRKIYNYNHYYKDVEKSREYNRKYYKNNKELWKKYYKKKLK